MNILLDGYLEYQEGKRKEAGIIPTVASLLEIATVTGREKVIDGMRAYNLLYQTRSA